MDIFVREQLAAFYKRFQNTEIDFLIRSFSLVCQVGSTAGDDGIVFRYKTIPKEEHIVRNRVNYSLGRFFTVWRFFFDNTERNQVFYISGANICVFPDFSGNLQHTGAPVVIAVMIAL